MLAIGLSVSIAQTPSHPQTSQSRSARIYGVVKRGTIPLGGVRVIAINPRTGKKYFTLTDGAGVYSIAVPTTGRFLVRAVFRSLISSTKQIIFHAGNTEQYITFSFDGPIPDSSYPSLWPDPLMSPVTANSLDLLPATGIFIGTSGAQFPSFIGDPTFTTDSFTVNGQPTIVVPYFQMADQMRQDFEDGHELQGSLMPPDKNQSSAIAHTDSSEPATQNKLHGILFWTGGYSALNASPFLLAGQPSPNPSYNSNSFGITVGGQPFLPGLIKASPKDFLLLSFSRQIATTLVSDYGVVPTDLERQGNFSQLVGPTGLLIPIYRPNTTTPYPNNTIDTPIDPVAKALLEYLPEPNLQGTGQNYQLLAPQGTHTNSLGISYTHNFGMVLGQTVSDNQGTSQTFDLNFNLGDVTTDVINIFPQLSGKWPIRTYEATAGYTGVKGEWIGNINLNFGRNDSQIRNYFTNGEDVATKVGVLGTLGTPLNSNPLNYGLPNLVFNNFNGMSQTQPNFQLTQMIGVSGSASWSHNSHIIRVGGNIRHIDFDLFGGTDATGTFIFTGAYTQMPGASNDNPVSPSGSSFADFLLGLPQQTKIEAPNQKAYTRQNNWDLFLRDDWHVRHNLTLLAGLRYDYFSPYAEVHDHLSTLDYNADFTRIAPVGPNGIGPISGASYPRTLIYPDRNRFSPHIGFAWQVRRNIGIRGGYGINATVGQYGSFIQNLAYQPPYAHVEANGNLVNPPIILFTLGNGFGNSADFGNYAINRNYRLPYVGVWYLDIEQMLPFNIVLDTGYSGSKGTRLDIINAPGYINNQLPFASAFFDFEDSTAFSNFNELIVRANKRMQNGIALQATYAYSHSIDNASSTNGGLPVVVQNWHDPLAEKSNSSFDIRQQITGSFLYELPFGAKKKYLNQNNRASRIFGDWSVSGFFILATGVPLTPFIAASVEEAARGTHGSVRPDRIRRVSIRSGGGHIDHWFNTAAFSTDFKPGQRFGTAGRNSIPGPGVDNIDLSLSKVLKLSDKRSLEFRADATNAFNVVQYAGVNTQFDSTTVGQVNAFQPMRQITFLARLRF